jgi:hypothetical protein
MKFVRRASCKNVSTIHDLHLQVWNQSNFVILRRGSHRDELRGGVINLLSNFGWLNFSHRMRRDASDSPPKRLGLVARVITKAADGSCLIPSEHILTIGDRGDDSRSDSPQERLWTAGGGCDHGVAFESVVELDIGVLEVADGSNGGAAFELAVELELSMSIVMDSRRLLQ